MLNIFFHNVTNMCAGGDPDGPIHPVQFTCVGFVVQAMKTDGLVWGMIGPQHLFASGQGYIWVNYFWLIGALAPIPVYMMRHQFPTRLVRKIHLPLVFTAVAQFSTIPSSVSYSSWFLVGLITQYWLRASYRGLWTALNYILSQALTCGTLVALIVISLTLDLPDARPLQDSAFVNANSSYLYKSPEQMQYAHKLWFGNRVEGDTIQGTPGKLALRPMPSIGCFAPAPNGEWLRPPPGSAGY